MQTVYFQSKHEIHSLIVWLEDKLIFSLQIEILLVKTEKFEELMAAEAEEKEFAADGEEQNWVRLAVIVACHW